MTADVCSMPALSRQILRLDGELLRRSSVRLAISSVTGPAPNSAGETVTLSGEIAADMLIGDGGRGSLA